MKNAVIFGAGNIGSVLIKNLSKEKVTIKYIIRSSGVFDAGFKKIAEQSGWKQCVDETDLACIAIPTKGKGEQALEYASLFLEKSKPVITCEKASIAYHWDYFKKYGKLFNYTASVGGGTKMLKRISAYAPANIHEIKAVVNGTLNYIACSLKSGKSQAQVVKEVLKKGYTEPGAHSFEKIIKRELQDILLKTIIIANHSRVFKDTIKENDVEVAYPEDNRQNIKRCIVRITRERIQAGFIEEHKSSWLPDGVNNVLYINGKKEAYGPGAGAEETVSAMIEDFHALGHRGLQSY